MIEFLDNLKEAFQLPVHDPIIAFFLILLIILVSPILLKKVNTPSIIGLIVAGILIGPNGFGILAPEMLHEGSAVSWFAKIGLLYIMFIAGLELDMNEFKSNRHRSVLFGIFTFAIPLAIGYPVCRYILDFGFNTSLLTASMFATHTLVAYPIVSQRGVSKNQAVATTVGGTILTDTAVLIILAIILGNARGSLDAQFWIQLAISLAIFTVIMFKIIPRIAEWFFRNLESEKHSHYIFVLAIMFFASFLSEVAGVEAIIGAFVAGLALNKLIPASSALMNRIEFMGNSLFIPFFLIGVGMIVDMTSLLGGWSSWIVAGTLTIVAVSGKWIAATITQWVFHYSRPQRQIIFGLSGAHAAATLAVIIVGHQAGIINDSILNGTIILILITSTIASFVTDKAAKDLLAESKEDTEQLVKSSGASDERILLPIKDVVNIDKFLDFAVLLKDKSSTNPISVLTVVSNNDEAEINILKAKEQLEEVVKEASASDTQTDVLTTIDHQVSKGVARISREVMADIIILGWPRYVGLFDRLIGNKIFNILKRTYKTTFVCHLEKPLVLHKKIVVAVPPLAECDKGFTQWLAKIFQLSQELSIPVIMYCNNRTRYAVEEYLEQSKSNTSISIKSFTDWEDFLVLSRSIHRDDLIVLVSARTGAKSHSALLDSLPVKLEKYFSSNNYVVVYPQHEEAPTDFDQLSNNSAKGA